MKKPLIFIFLMACFTLFLNGCLTCEKKEYSFRFTGENSGILTIKYLNLMSTMNDTTDVSEEDFASLINDYYNGTTAESEFPGSVLIGKRLFEENGQLCAELQLEFKDLAGANLFRHMDKGPFMYCLNCGDLDGETYEQSNGEYGGEIMPVVFWEQNLKELLLSTYLTMPDETTVSLLDHYKTWQASN